MFGMMERAAQNMQIEDFSVTQTTLDQVFMPFVHHQTGETTAKEKKKQRKRQRRNI